MPETAEEPANEPVIYRYEQREPFNREDAWLSAGGGLIIGFTGGIATYALVIDADAIRYNDQVLNTETNIDIGINPVRSQQKLTYLQKNPVPDAPGWEGVAAGAVEMGFGTLLSAGFLIACHWAAFKRRMHKREKKIAYSRQILDFEQAYRQSPSSGLSK